MSCKGGAPAAAADRLSCWTASRYIRTISPVCIYVAADFVPTQHVPSTSDLNVSGRLRWERGTGTAVSGHLPFQLFRWRLGCSLPALDMLTISRMFCPVQFRVVCCRLCDNLCLTTAEKNEAWKAIWEELGPLLRTALVAGLLEAILACSSL